MNAQPDHSIFALRTTVSDVTSHDSNMVDLSRRMNEQAAMFRADANDTGEMIALLEGEVARLKDRQSALTEDAIKTEKMASIVAAFVSGQSGTTVAPKKQQYDEQSQRQDDPPVTSDPSPGLTAEQIAELESEVAAAAQQGAAP